MHKGKLNRVAEWNHVKTGVLLSTHTPLHHYGIINALDLEKDGANKEPAATL